MGTDKRHDGVLARDARDHDRLTVESGQRQTVVAET